MCERLESIVDGAPFSCGKKIEQQAARNGDSESRMRPGGSTGEPITIPDRRRANPVVDDAVEERQCSRLALQGQRVDLEEQPLVRSERRVGEAPPEESHDLGRSASFRVGLELSQRPSRLLLDGAGNLDEESLARAEVVDEHAVTGAERGGDLPQALTVDPVFGDVIDSSLQQTASDWPVGAALGHLCTAWYAIAGSADQLR